MTSRGSSVDVDRLSWPVERLAEAVHAVAQRAGLSPGPAISAQPPSDASAEALQRWMESVAQHVGVEAEPVEIRHGYLQQSLRRRAPVILRGQGNRRFLCVLSASGRHARLLGPDRSVWRVSSAALRRALRSTLENEGLVAGVDSFLARAAIPPARHARVRAAYFNHVLGHIVAVDGWSLRPRPGSSFRQQLRLARIPALTAGFLILHALRSAGWVLSWWLLGRAALRHHDAGWFLAWLFMLGTLVPLRLWAARFEALFGVGVGALMKKRLLDGALRLDLGTTRTQGVGQLLGRAIEAEGVESLALGGWLQSVVAVVELATAVFAIVAATSEPTLAWLLVPWVIVAIGGSGLLLRRRRSWAEERLQLTHHLVESMVGYRTRLAQETPARWHDGEDEAASRYFRRSHEMDRLTSLLLVLVPRGWLIVGLLGLLSTVGAVGPGSEDELAVGVGIVLLAHGALSRLVAGLMSLIDAAIAWRQVRELFRAASLSDAPGLTPFVTMVSASQIDSSPDGTSRPIVLSAADVTYRYPNRTVATLRGCSLQVRAGDRVLLEGPSGGGKSTLATVLAGVRKPDSGLLLVHGLDLAALGEQGWRKRVVVVPQFHENHVMADTLLFNLLMGRRWPARPEEIEEAQQVCSELGLGPLLARMPAGLQQPVGDTGWRLSHGERSRLFVARALLQGADVVIFDESFAALDPETLRHCLGAVLRRKPATLVIAHP